MYVMIRRYPIATGSIVDRMHKLDTQVADALQEPLGILLSQGIDL